jgi:hypothetical protein
MTIERTSDWTYGWFLLLLQRADKIKKGASCRRHDEGGRAKEEGTRRALPVGRLDTVGYGLDILLLRVVLVPTHTSCAPARSKLGCRGAPPRGRRSQTEADGSCAHHTVCKRKMMAKSLCGTTITLRTWLGTGLTGLTARLARTYSPNNKPTLTAPLWSPCPLVSVLVLDTVQRRATDRAPLAPPAQPVILTSQPSRWDYDHCLTLASIRS